MTHSTEEPLPSTAPVSPDANANLADITRDPGRPLFEDELQAMDATITGAKFPAALRYFLRQQRRHDIRNVPALWWWPLSRQKTDIDDVYLEAEESGRKYEGGKEPTTVLAPIPLHCFIKRGAWATPMRREGLDLKLVAEASITFIEALRIGAALEPTNNPIEPMFPRDGDVIQQGDIRFVVVHSFRPIEYFTTGAQPLVYGGTLKPIRPDSNISSALPALQTQTPEIPLWPV